MASKAILAFFLLFVTSTLARHQQWQQQQNQCQIQNIEALEPYNIIQAEAGVTEIWDANNQQFQCAGVDFIRHRIQPGGLLLPSYVNTPILSFIEKGQGVQGVILPGCPETYEYSPEEQQSEGSRREGSESRSQFQDRHQKVENLRQGDVVAIPTGAAHWLHNDGDTELVAVVFFDIQNSDNQLDENHRRFFLAGNTQDQSQQHQQSRPRRQEQDPQRQPRRQEEEERRQPHRQEEEQRQPRRQEEEERRQPHRQEEEQRQPRRQEEEQRHSRRQRQGEGQRRQEQQYENSRNIFSGLDVEFIAEAFNVDREIAEKLQGQQDNRGHIVNVGRELQIIRPREQHQQQRQHSREERRRSDARRGSGGWSNGFEETICSMKLRSNIDNPSHADFVNPEAGKIANLNSFKFPILKHIQLSAERGQLERNAIRSPFWTINAHSLLYVTEGALRVQIVNNEGNSVFDDELREGQVVVIPQNFAVIKRAGEQGSRWVSFKTNDNAMISNLAGRVSAISSLPVDVVANSYQMSRDDAQRLKFSQRETVLFSPNQGRRASA